MKFTSRVWSLISISFLINIYTETKADPEKKILNNENNCDNDNGLPICATNGTENILFSNKCVLNQALKSTKELKKTLLRNCLQKCRFYCVSIYEPICALDPTDNTKRTFHNRCELVKNGCILDKDWIFYKNGICYESGSQKLNRKKRNTDRKRRDPIPCPKVFNPVCGTLAGVKSTFINECQLNAENVKFNKEWILLSEGMCAEDYSYYTPRSHKNKRSFAGNQFNGFNERLFLGDDFVQIRAPSIFQTHFIKDPTPPFVSDRSESFKYPPIYQTSKPINHIGNLRHENLQSRHKYQSGNTFEVQEGSYKNFDGTISDILRILQRNIGDENSETFLDTSSCKLGNIPLCCKFQGNKYTFKNICELNLHNERTDEDWIILYEGECIDCDIYCPNTFDPVCASRKGLNYTIRNECLLKSTMCQDKLGSWKLLKKGICDDNEPQIIRDKYESTPLGFQYTQKLKKSSKTTKELKETTSKVLTDITESPSLLTTNTYFPEITLNFDRSDATTLSSQSTTAEQIATKHSKNSQISKNNPNTILDIMIKSSSFLMPAQKNTSLYSLNDMNIPSDVTTAGTKEDFPELKGVKANITSKNSNEIFVIQPWEETTSLANDG